MGPTNMATVRKQSASRADTRKIRNLTEELSREEHGLGIPLLDAAVAGVILGFKRRIARCARRRSDAGRP